MGNVQRKIELTANVLIIIVALVFCIVFIQRNFFPTLAVKSKQTKETAPEIGAKVSLPNFTWPQERKTLILVLKAGCRFCDESMPFYRRILKMGNESNVKLVAVFPTGVEEGTSYLSKYGIADIEVRQMPLKDLHVRGTPTLILTNEFGEVANFWVGRLPQEKEDEVINLLL